MKPNEYGNGAYCSYVFEPDKNQITVKAFKELKEFITKAVGVIEMNDLKLTEIENKVMSLISDGLNTDEAADKLYLSRNTVISHLQAVYSKYGISGRCCNTRAVLTYLRNTGRMK